MYVQPKLNVSVTVEYEVEYPEIKTVTLISPHGERTEVDLVDLNEDNINKIFDTMRAKAIEAQRKHCGLKYRSNYVRQSQFITNVLEQPDILKETTFKVPSDSSKFRKL